MVKGISPDDIKFTQKILENFDLHFSKDFKTDLSDFLHRNYTQFFMDREIVVIMILTAAFAYAICSQSEERYIQYFESINSLGDDDAEEVRMFLNNLVHDVETKNLSMGSMHKVSSSRRVIFGFENKLTEYEVKIQELNSVLVSANRELKRGKEKTESLIKDNDRMKVEIRILTKNLSEMNEKYAEQLKAIVSEKEMTFAREMKDMRRRLEDAEAENSRMKDKIDQVRQKKDVIKQENKSHRKTLSVLSDNYVDKEAYDKKTKEKLELERKLMELENNYAVEISETKSLKDQLEKTKNDKKKIMEEKDKEYERKLNEIRMQYQAEQDNVFNNIKLNKSAMTNNQLDKMAGQKVHDWDRLTNILDNDFNRNNFNNSDFDFKTKDPIQASMENEFIDRVERLQNKFEELKALSSSENDGLREKIKQMSDEIYRLKTSRISESNFVTTRTYSRLRSQNQSGLKKNSDISEEFVSKVVDLEKKVKTLTNENKYLHQSIIKNLGAYKTQTDIFYSVIKSYVGRMER